MTSPVDGNDVFGLLSIQYTYRFIGKTRGNEGVHYDMTNVDDVRKAYIANNKPKPETEVCKFQIEPQASETTSVGIASQSHEVSFLK